VLFVGVGVGMAIALAFQGHGSVFGAATPSPAPASTSKVAGGPARGQAPIQAATPPLDCAAPVPSRLLTKIAAGQPITIGVFGDSFGDGVWAALYRQLAKENIKVLRLSHEGTGFTRYQTTNLEEKAAEQVAAEPVDLAVVVIGANDTQGLFEGKHAYAFLSPGWKAAYGGRIDRFVSVIRGQGAMVYWLGLPKMRQPRYDQDVAALNEFAATRMAALDVPYLSTRELSVDDKGDFNLYLSDPGAKEPRLMRANDGVHMTMTGYERLAGPLIARIRDYVAHARATASLSVPAPDGGRLAAAAVGGAS